MTVYVDDAGHWSLWSRVLRRRHHVYADSRHELILAADMHGIPRDRIRREGAAGEHLLASSAQRRALIAAGAERISYPGDTAELVARRRQTGTW